MLFRYFHDLGLEFALQEEPRNRMDEKDEQPLQFPKAAAPSTSISPSAPQVQTSPTQITPLPIRKAIAGDHPAYACKTLAELRQTLEAFDGCDLKKTATHTVFCDGNPNADVMLIGEAPGAEEDLQGKPFVGMSGQLLDKMLGAIGLDRTTVYIANIVPWRPPANRTPSTQEVAICQPFIEQHIYLKKPKFLVLLGGVATKAILNNHAGIMRLRGQWQSYTPPVPGVKNDGEFQAIRTLPTFHPAFLLRSPNQKIYAWEDLKTLKAAIEGKG